MFKWIEEMGDIPKYYGVAYRTFGKYGSMCAPIPLNLLIRLYKEIKDRVKAPRWGNDGSKDYWRGYKDGRKIV